MFLGSPQLAFIFARVMVMLTRHAKGLAADSYVESGSLDISCVSPLVAQIARPDNFAGCSFGVCRCLTLHFLVNIFNTFRKSSQSKWWLQWNVFEAYLAGAHV